MKVCILTHTFPRYDKDIAAPFMDGVARGISQSGNEAFVLTPYSPYFRKTSKPYEVITYKYIFPKSLHKLGYSDTLSDDKTIKPLMWFLSPFMIIFGTLALYKLVKKKKIDIINAHWILPNGFMAAIVSILTKVPVVQTLPGSDVYIANKNIVFRLMVAIATHRARAITSNSKQLLDDLAKITNQNIKEKSYQIIYGVNPKKFKPNRVKNNRLRNKIGINRDSIVILGVGRLVAKKGFYYLVKAAPIIIKDRKNVDFVIVGEGDQKERLINIAKKLEIINKFHFIGAIDYENLVDYYNLSDIFILPSIRDNQGNLDDQSVSVVEAMSCGKPIITTNLPGYRLVIKNRYNGYLVGQKDTSAIAEKIIHLAGSKKVRLKMGVNSRENAIKKCSWTHIGRQYIQLFKKII